VTRLILCRHAEAGRAEQAEALAIRFDGTAIAAVYTSPLERAADTARALAARHKVRLVEVGDLREIDFGEALGLTFEELPHDLRTALLQRPTEVRFPGGENYSDLQRRVTTALDEVVAAHPGATVAVVSHAGAIRAALAAWLRMADDAAFRLDQRPAAVNVVDWFDGTPFVRLVNGTEPEVGSPAARRRRTMRA
jgi:broad specificity phosphatase PhoE